MTEFVYDTYALMEILHNNPQYLPYVDHTPIINQFILAEFCYHLYKESAEDVNHYMDTYAPSAQPVDTDLIKEAMEFRYTHRKQKLSMTDCIGYIHAKQLGVKFLTGDKEFEGMENVEFVK